MNKPELITARSSRAARLRQLLLSPELEFIMEAHNGLSARIVEEAGFKGIWASGLAVSAQFGVRDNNEASWTQVVDMLEFMTDATTIPILLDGDTGYGNFNNMRRLVRKLEQRNVAGVCIEDKLFPKANSFIDGERQPLADIDEFCGKIKAGKDSQNDRDFCIVARVEALIAGWDMTEAIRRADAYRQAGADAILIHSKLSRAEEILAFAKEWCNRAPVIIVPTKYYSTPVEVYRRARISLVIWANHMVRAAVAAMQSVASEIQRTGSLLNVEDGIASVNEIFRLQGAAELKEAELRYAGGSQARPRAIVLAASRGDELERLTQSRPKVMLSISGKPLLRRLIDEFKREGINDTTVVAGYRADAIDVPGIKVTVNPHYATTGELASLVCAESDVGDDTVILYGDLLFRSYILRDLLDSDGEIVTVVDSATATQPASGSPDYAWCSVPDDRAVLDHDVRLLRVGKETGAAAERCSGRWIGMLRVRGAGRGWLLEALGAMKRRADYHVLGLPHVLNYLVEQARPIRVLYINGHWLDVNSLEDLDRAGDFTRGAQ
ncbi:MAG: phosphoenolpyruvate mutase [Chromatiales bacterium]